MGIRRMISSMRGVFIRNSLRGRGLRLAAALVVAAASLAIFATESPSEPTGASLAWLAASGYEGSIAARPSESERSCPPPRTAVALDATLLREVHAAACLQAPAVQRSVQPIAGRDALHRQLRLQI